MTLQTLIILGVFAPLLGAAIAGFFGRRIGDIPSQAVTTGLLFFSCAVAWTVFGQWTWGHLEPFTIHLAPFINVGDFQSAWSIRIDALSATMLIVVTSVSSLVHLYSWGYMAEDDSRPRFFAYLSLFTFMMLALVTAADFMQIFFGWEGVGLASYLLIGFWFKKPTASAAAIKAFVVNRVGDFGFVLGIMTIFWMYGTIEFAELFPMIGERAGTTWEFLGVQWSALDLAGFLLFIGAMGKSAQFFLHTWLPDAMEGPTPVSALIHAATMVTAGVYMVCLLSPIYEHAPGAAQIIAIIGAITALFHVGGEQGWWALPATCMGGASVDVDALAALAAGTAPAGPLPSCGDVAWSWLGLSMAGWNVLISLALATFSLLAAKRPKDARAPRIEKA